MSKLTTADALSEIASKYKSSVASSLVEDSNSISAINAKYKINDGAADDVSNLCKFLDYCVVKDTECIDSAENVYSKTFSRIMLDYADSAITNEDLADLLNMIMKYNSAVDSDYSLNFTDTDDYSEVGKRYANIITKIFGMDASSPILTISEDSYAERIFNVLKKQYVSATNTTFVDFYDTQFLKVMTFLFMISGLDEISSYRTKILNTENLDRFTGWKNTSTSLYEIDTDPAIVKTLKNADGDERDVRIKKEGSNDLSVIEKNSYYCGYVYGNPLFPSSDNKYFYIFYSKISDVVIESYEKKYKTNTTGEANPIAIDLSKNVYCAIPSLNKGNTVLPSGAYKILFRDTDGGLVSTFSQRSDTTNGVYGIYVNAKQAYEYLKYANNNTDSEMSLTFISSDSSQVTIDTVMSSKSVENNNFKQLSDVVSASASASTTLSSKLGLSENSFIKYFYDNGKKSLINDNGSNYDMSQMYSLLLNKLKIVYELPELTVSLSKNLSTTYTEGNDILHAYLMKYEKRSANDVESYRFQQRENVVCLNLMNIAVPDTDEETIAAISKFVNYTAKNSTTCVGSNPKNTILKSNLTTSYTYNDKIKYTVFGIRVAYKEFNKILRMITYADAKDTMMAELCNSGIRFTEAAYEAFYNAVNSDDSKYTSHITEEQKNILRDLKTNDILCRVGNDSDIIAYLSGPTIDFGSTIQQKKDIQNFVKIYSNIRNYYYKVLMNRSFVNEDGYKVYERLVIAAASIDKFLTSRINTTRTLDDYTDSDCDNFMKSFGLKSLDNQINQNDFSNSITYKRRIISKYNDLMSRKGSKSVLDTLFSIFDYSDVDISIFKYIIYDAYDNASTPEPEIISVPYNSSNIGYYLSDSQNTPRTKYADFILKDSPYWTITDVPSETVKKYIETPQTTKYLGVSATKKLYDDFIKSKYAISVVRYLQKKYVWTDNGTTSSLMDKIQYSPSIDSLSGKSYSIRTMFDACTLMFMVYTLCAENYYKNSSVYGPDDFKAESGFPTIKTNSSAKYFGISETATIKDLTTTDKTLIDSIFTTIGVSTSDSGKTTEIKYFTWKTGTLDTASADAYGESIYRDAVPSPISTLPKYILPLDTYSSSTNLKISDSYKSFMDDMTEIGSNSSSSAEDDNNSYELTSEDAITTAFKSINLINLINSNAADANADANLFDKLDMAYDYEKLAKTGATIYADATLGTTPSINTSDDFPIADAYTNIMFDMVNFPTKYLNGDYTMASGICATKRVRDILDDIFSNFFEVKSAEIPYFAITDATSLSDNLKTILTQENFPFLSDTENSALQNYVLEDAVTKESTDTYLGIASSDSRNTIPKYFDKIFNSSYSKSNMKLELETIYDKLIVLLNSVLSFTENEKKIELTYSISQSVSNFFDFVQSAVKFFISYTTTLYTASLKFSYDSKFDRIPLAYELKETITKTIQENVFYDENVSIEEFI